MITFHSPRVPQKTRPLNPPRFGAETVREKMQKAMAQVEAIAQDPQHPQKAAVDTVKQEMMGVVDAVFEAAENLNQAYQKDKDRSNPETKAAIDKMNKTLAQVKPGLTAAVTKFRTLQILPNLDDETIVAIVNFITQEFPTPVQPG